MLNYHSPSENISESKKVILHGGGGWARNFGYDIFISFALGPQPRGTRGYASDMARKLREQGFTVFFSEDEAPVGNELNHTLRRALERSRLLLVIANKETLDDPRWVRTEVEEFTRRHPRRPVVTININHALPKDDTKNTVSEWLPFRGRIWVDESRDACLAGQVSDAVIERVITAPRAVRSLTRLRYTIASIIMVFAGVSVLALMQRTEAINQRNSAQHALLSSAAKQATLQSQNGRAQEGWTQLVNVLRDIQPNVDGPLPEDFLRAALTTLTENRLGPALTFDKAKAAALKADEFETPVVPVAKFDANSQKVAVAVDRNVGVWSTKDGMRILQTSLVVKPQIITFTDSGSLLIVEGREVDEDSGESDTPARAFAIDLRSGKISELPLMLCLRMVPCIAKDASVKKLLPLTAFTGVDELQKGNSKRAAGYLVNEAKNKTLLGVSSERYYVLRDIDRKGNPQSEYLWVFDTITRGIRRMTVESNEAVQVSVATHNPLFVISSPLDSRISLYRIENGNTENMLPTLNHLNDFQARYSAGITDVVINADGTTLGFENNNWGTGTGNGRARAVLLNLQTGKEIWAREDVYGKIIWGNDIAALETTDGSTHLIASQTGMTWFSTPDSPAVFSSNGQMLLTLPYKNNKDNSLWPNLQLVETLPVSRFSNGLKPASLRSLCSEPEFLTLSERYDRIWNQNDWHRIKTPEMMSKEFFSPMVNYTTLMLTHEASKWQVYDSSQPSSQQQEEEEEEEGLPVMTQEEVIQKYPLLTGIVRAGYDGRINKSVSPDAKWIGLIQNNQGDENNPYQDKRCEGWATWQLYSTEGNKLIRHGCVTGDSPGSNFLPAIQFFEGIDVADQKGNFAVIPVDTCNYQIVRTEDFSVVGEVTPVLGNDVQFTYLEQGLFGVMSRDWYGETTAYQLYDIKNKETGPVFALATAARTEDEKKPTEKGDPEKFNNTVGLLYPTDYLEKEYDSSDGSDLTEMDANWHEMKIGNRGENTVILGVPVWGERLKEKLRQDVQHSASEQNRQSPP